MACNNLQGKLLLLAVARASSWVPAGSTGDQTLRVGPTSCLGFIPTRCSLITDSRDTVCSIQFDLPHHEKVSLKSASYHFTAQHCGEARTMYSSPCSSWWPPMDLLQYVQVHLLLGRPKLGPVLPTAHWCWGEGSPLSTLLYKSTRSV